MERHKIRGRAIYAATALALLALTVGYALAAVTVTNGSESGNGNYVNANALAWWTTSAANPAGVYTVPGATPAVLSTTIGTPTVLAAAGQNYGINAQTAGDVAQIFKFTEAAGAPANTEVEIQFQVSTGAGTTVTNVYIESQAAPPGAAQTFVLYFDAGSAAGGTVTINYGEQISLQCSAVGSCP